MNSYIPDIRDIDKLYERLFQEAESSGYHLNPDEEFTRGLVQGLLVNENRYGYWACPCRLADGVKKDDLDIICPCDYRDADLGEYGACYCKLYVTNEVVQGKKQLSSIPERRPEPEERIVPVTKSGMGDNASLSIWRCRVCGYLCGREQPPEVCPICKAKKERFEKFEGRVLFH